MTTVKKTTLLLFVTALFCAPVYAQSNGILVLFFEQPGSVWLDDFIIGRIDLRDANGDGIPDLTLQRDDEQGNLQSLRVLDGSTHEVIWEVPDVQTSFTDGTADRDVVFYGFIDPLGAGTPYALFSSSEDVFLIDLADNSEAFRTLAPGPSVLSSVGDVTGDGLVDLIISVTDTDTVQGYYLGQTKAGR